MKKIWPFKKFYPLASVIILIVVLAAAFLTVRWTINSYNIPLEKRINGLKARIDTLQAKVGILSSESILPADTIYFCGEKITLLTYSDKLAYLKAKAYYLDHSKMTLVLLLALDYYSPVIEQALKTKGLPEDLKYVPVVESALNLWAKSWAEAVGLWQFTKPTGRRYGLRVNGVDQRLDPVFSSQAAAKYLSDLYNKFGNWPLALAAYNAGDGRIKRALKEWSSVDKDSLSISILPVANETQAYPFFIIAFREIAQNRQKYGFPPPKHNYFGSAHFDTLTVNTAKIKKGRLTFSQIASVCNVPLPVIRELNPSFREDKIPGGQWLIRVPAGKRDLLAKKY